MPSRVIRASSAREESQPSTPQPLHTSPPRRLRSTSAAPPRSSQRSASASLPPQSTPYISSDKKGKQTPQASPKAVKQTPQASKKGKAKKSEGSKCAGGDTKKKTTKIVLRITKSFERLVQEEESKVKEEEEKLCVSTFMREVDWDAIRNTEMPSLDKGGNVGKSMKRRASSSVSRPTSSQKKSSVNGNGSSDGKEGKNVKSKKADVELERNIDTVIFGDVTFKAWYPSWYPKEIIGEKALEGQGKGITVPELYVCSRCFAYGKVLVDWVGHLRCCEKKVPGQRVYVHGGEGDGKDGRWSVWEVDGGVDTLFCQNLSLFAKLFLDNKSVFFDVSGFNYFLLVHTSPTGQQQIIGFFSKEKMSWDNNNLACILVFPPWQRKGLGSLLMGVSYSIAKREGILGGPEKPISDLGKKGYKRYWGAEIARWLLECKETDKKKSKGLVDVNRISQETWILPEDCLGILREMGVVEKAGKGKGTAERVRIDKEAVRKWVGEQRLGLDRVVDEAGFVEGYAMKEVEEEDEE